MLRRTQGAPASVAAPLPTPWAEYWNRDDFWTRSPLWEVNADLFVKRAESLAVFRPDDRVLNIGCGPGLLEERLASRVRSIRAVDVAPRFVELCRRRCQGRPNVTATLLGSDYTNLEALGGRYSLFLSVSVVQYYRNLGEIESLIRSAGRCAAPGARMLLADLPLRRGPLGFAWDALGSVAMSLAEGYFPLLTRTALSRWLGPSRYRASRRAMEQISFQYGELEDLRRRLNLNATIIKRSLSIYAHRPSLLIRL